MFSIIGVVVVLGAVGLGYFLEGGNFGVLWQPAELVIIGGAALGAMILSVPKDVLSAVFKGMIAVFKPNKTSKAFYMEMLIMLSSLFLKIRREGLVAIEKDVEHPEQSPIFQGFMADKSNHEIVEFVCDTMRIFSTVNIEAHEFENIMEADLEVAHHEAMAAPQTITKIGDSLPGLGIVAAVLGVVLTMGKISEPPEVLGHSIGAALVGTFLGILMCYGFMGPIASNLEHRCNEIAACMLVVKSALIAFVGGNPPPVALEAGRRAIPLSKRPSFQELEEALKAAKGK